jgi:hypothetical protein
MEKTFQEQVEELYSRRFSVNKEIPKDDCNFKIFVRGELYDLGSKGCIGMFAGRQKSRKTFALSCVIASAMRNEPVGPFQYIPNGGVILDFDTEQPYNRFLMSRKRLYNIANITTDHDRFYSFNLRSYDIPTRVALIDFVIKDFMGRKIPIDLIVIDGIVDICANFMENTEAQATAQKLMTWSDITQASIFNVLHTNKVGGEMRGHLGTEMGNKTDFTIMVEKKSDDDVFSIVKCKDSRYSPFPHFDLYQAKDGLIDLDRGSWQDPDAYVGAEIINSPF